MKQIIDKHNTLKYSVLSSVFDRHLTSYEISVLLFDGDDFGGPEFQAFYKKIGVALNRYSKDYDSSKDRVNKGFSVPYLSKRWIKSHTEQKERHGLYEYKATPKGRRMVCEWGYRIRMGHTSLKWIGGYFMPRTLCDGACKTCLIRTI
jgi:hypothetical protein